MSSDDMAITILLLGVTLFFIIGWIVGIATGYSQGRRDRVEIDDIIQRKGGDRELPREEGK